MCLLFMTIVMDLSSQAVWWSCKHFIFCFPFSYYLFFITICEVFLLKKQTCMVLHIARYTFYMPMSDKCRRIISSRNCEPFLWYEKTVFPEKRRNVYELY